MMNKKVKIISACVLTLAVTLSGLVLPRAYGANAVDVNRKCSVEINLQNNVYGTGSNAADFSELEGLEIPVHLYKVADISETGAYKAATGFEVLELDKINSTTSAGEWEAKAAKAKDLIEKGVTPISEKQVTVENGTAKAEELETGMYLMVAESVKSPYFTYSFKENLISLPNNYYSFNVKNSSDEWIYDLTGNNAVGLKPNREERLGDLKINKTLTSYNATVGGATFVFHVEVKKLDGTIQTNVYKMEFAGTGSDSLTIPNLPAGAEVTVTEEYTGSSYKLVSGNDQKATIVAKNDVTDSTEHVESASVSFVNEYDGGHNGGSGVVNNFYKDDKSIGWRNDLSGGDK